MHPKSCHVRRQANLCLLVENWIARYRSTLGKLESVDWLYIINASAVIGAGHGIVMNKDANPLTDVHGETKLTNDRVKNLLRRMGFVKQNPTVKLKLM